MANSQLGPSSGDTSAQGEDRESHAMLAHGELLLHGWPASLCSHQDLRTRINAKGSWAHHHLSPPSLLLPPSNQGTVWHLFCTDFRKPSRALMTG